MLNTTVKYLFAFIFFTVFAATRLFAQTITIGSVDPGPYGPGSTIAIPFTVTGAGCIERNNTYSLYMSDATGSFASETLVATLPNTFYATFFNYTLPTTGLVPSVLYRFRITASSPNTVPASSPSSAVTIISTGSSPTARTSSTSINATNPDVFGRCSSPLSSYTFTNTSQNSTNVSIRIFDNQNNQVGVNHDITSTPYTFNAASTNYTIIVRANDGLGTVSTRAYPLINNVVNTSIGSTGSDIICINPNVTPASATYTYNIDVSSSTGIQNNYPGTTYVFSWGDGTPATVLTLCQIVALGGKVNHSYTSVSCGLTVNNQVNRFAVDLDVISSYCGQVGSRNTSYARVVTTPINTIGPIPAATACTNALVTFTNLSTPGPDPNANTATCDPNPNALYTWLVDGVAVPNYIGVPRSTSLQYTFNTHGNHIITLQDVTGNGACFATDAVYNICIQDAPQPSFTLPASPVCRNSPLIPTNTSVVDNICNQPTYTWSIFQANGTTPATGITYAGGTDANSPTPQFLFPVAGIYRLQLTITSASCGTFTTAQQTITVESTPTAVLSQDFTSCGNNQTLTFGPAGGQTQTLFTGTPTTGATTYTWTVTGNTNFSFAPGSDLHSQYPQIIFNDFATYTVTVTHTNSCGTVATDSQNITFQNAPTVNAGTTQIICQGSGPVHLNGTITGTYNSSEWVSDGTGTFTPSANNTLTPDYNPSAVDFIRGFVNLTLQANTSLPSPCNLVTSTVLITLVKTTEVTSPANKPICSNSGVSYNIETNNDPNPTVTFAWTASLTSGSVTGFSPTGTSRTISDVLVNTTPTVTGSVTYRITPSTNGCPGIPFDLVVTIPAIPVVTPTAANPAICSNSPTGITMASNQTDTRYTWTVSFPPGISGAIDQTTQTASTAINNILVNNTAGVLRVTYNITPYNIAGCAGTPVDVFVDVNPPAPVATVGPTQNLCNETQTTLTGNDPGSSFTGQWTQVSGNTVTITTPNNFQTTVTGLVGGQNYTFEWTINGIAPCGPTSAQITIINNAPTIAGNTSGNATVCAGENGQVTLIGHRGSILYWERSENTGATWIRENNTTSTLSYTNIRQTTQFRAYVQNGNCDILISPLTVVRVNQPPPPANAGPNQILCNQPSVNLEANNPGTFVGTWSQVSGLPVTITNPNNYQTTVTGLTGANNYVFRWTITAEAPCVDTFDEVTITNNPDVVASFTANTKVGCGDLTVQFTNTSNNQAGANFVWNFGDGQISNVASPQHTFAQRTDGRDTTYYISLAVQGNCVQRAAIVDSILVRPAVPLARILPASTAGCGNYAIDIRNTTPGNNVSYVFYLYDGNTLLQTITKTDKTNAVFSPITTTARRVFTVYMVATGYCNNIGESTHIPVSISPSDVVAQMVIQGGINAGCAPLNTTLINNSFGGDNFYYNIYDANNNLVDRPVAGTTPLPYRFSTAGTYYVTITAISNCGSTESPRTRIDVYATPTPSFVADITTGCKDGLITFTNNTVSNDPNTPVTSLLYDWDFGDGSPHSALFAPTHGYHFTGTPYTVTLRATNTTSGCTEIFVRTAYINLYGPPKTAFDIRPDSVTNIPNYTFSFIDRTPTDAVSWTWTFGDGQTSTRRNPTVTYPDTGVYRVTLTTTTANGCDSTITKTVKIGGVPGQLFLPNAFIPESLTTELRTFAAKGSGIKTWRLQIFNNYGQLVWQTTKLSPKGEPEEGWDGTFKGVPAPQGVYQWQASATFINGTEWKGNSYRDELPKRVGSVHLIR